MNDEIEKFFVFYNCGFRYAMYSPVPVRLYGKISKRVATHRRRYPAIYRDNRNCAGGFA